MKFAFALVLGMIALSGCAHRRLGRRASVPPPPPAPPGASAPESPKAGPPGTARSAPSRASTPGTESAAPEPLYTETGVASWYGHPYHGRPAADGEIYDMEKMTAAHRTLPFDTMVRVVNLSNNKSVEVRITDRGPFVDGRIIDLSHAAASAIDMIGPGTAEVRMEVLSLPEITAPALFAVQVGAFRDKLNAEHVRARMAAQYGPARLVRRDDTPTIWRVLVGAEKTEDGAAALKTRIRKESGERNAFIVRLDS
jgi:peptidoglycan lytic transglycosylase